MAQIPTEHQQEIRERIRQLIALLGVSQSRFANFLGISAANMSKHLSGKLPVTHGLINRICLDYGIARQWLLKGEDMPFAKSEGDNLHETEGKLTKQGIPVYDIDVTAGFGSLERCFTEDSITGYMSLPFLNNSDNERIVRVSGNSMEPSIPDGSYIAIREVQCDTIFWGQAYVIVLDDYRMVKIIRRHADSTKIILHSDNPDYDDIEVRKDKIIGLYKVDTIINFTATS